jgi:hypothetical protein
MNLYLISQIENMSAGSCSGLVVAAETEGDAAKVVPTKAGPSSSVWCSNMAQLSVELIGVAKKSMQAGTIISEEYND